MRLSRSEILREVEASSLSFNPPVPRDLIKDSSVDLYLSETFYSLEPLGDLAQARVAGAIELQGYRWDRFIRRFGRGIIIPADGYLYIPVQQLMLGYTRERVNLPQHLGGWVEGKSGNARIGLFVHISVPAVHPGLSSR